jgi:hypothetical protein
MSGAQQILRAVRELESAFSPRLYWKMAIPQILRSQAILSQQAALLAFCFFLVSVCAQKFITGMFKGIQKWQKSIFQEDEGDVEEDHGNFG